MYREFPPSATLSSSVVCYWTRSGEGRHRVLPDGCIDILFTSGMGGSWRGVVVGTMSTAIVTDSPPSVFVGVRFKPGEAVRYLDTRAGEVTDLDVSLDTFWGGEARRLEERMSACGSLEEQVALLDAEMVRRYARARPADFRLRRAIDTIQRKPSSIDEIARSCGIGTRQLHRLFVERVGVGPKVFARVMRLGEVVRWLDLIGPGRTVGSLAGLAGFADQPHLIREFRALAGVCPMSYVRERAMSDSFKPGEPGPGMSGP